MKISIASIFPGLCILLMSASASAMLPIEVEVICPIGGETFKTTSLISSSSNGQRPDGRAYGMVPVWPIIECPGNGFLIFERDFSEEELAVLEPLILSNEFQRMRDNETQGYRMWWLQKELARESAQLASSLLRASWESDDNLARKRRYQILYVEQALAQPPEKIAAQSHYWLWARAANALRELGRFDEAKSLILQLKQPALLPADAEERRDAQKYLAQLHALASERNSVSEPANMIPIEEAIFVCVARSDHLTLSERKTCNGRKALNELSAYKYRTDSGRVLRGRPAVRAFLAKQ